jgi:hypothetical protein
MMSRVFWVVYRYVVQRKPIDSEEDITSNFSVEE